MPFEIDPKELGLELDETQTSAFQQTLSDKVQQAIDAEVSGLKTKNTELLGNNRKLKSEFDALKGQFDGLDIEAVKGLQKKPGRTKKPD